MSKPIINSGGRGYTKIKIFGITFNFVIFIISYFLIITGATYAYLNVAVNSGATAISGTAACGVISYNGTDVTGENLNSSVNYIDGAHSVVTLSKNAGYGYAEASIYIHNNTGSTIPFDSSVTGSEAFKYIVLDGTTQIGGGIITKGNSDQLLVTIPLTTTAKNYDIYIWIDANVSYGAYNGVSYSGYIYAEAICNSTLNYDGEKLFGKVINNSYLDNISSTYVSSSSGIDFTANNSDTNGKGVYIRAGTEDNAYPVYYYRGDVTNNNVIFDGMCFKIVRTTDTGGIKMIYNGIPSNGKCNNAGTDTQIGTGIFNDDYNGYYYLSMSRYMFYYRYLISAKTQFTGNTDYVFGNSVNDFGELIDTITINSNNWSTSYNTINNNHYTYFNNHASGDYTIYFVFLTTNARALDFTVRKGENVDVVLQKSFNYNVFSSSVKGDKDTSGSIDYWYYNNIYLNLDSKGNSYNTYVEDTVYCNDSSFANYDESGFSPSGSTSTTLYFGAYGRITSTPLLDCPRNIDKFTVSSGLGNGSLDYPVGLLTIDEVRFAGGKNNNYNYYLWNGTYGSGDKDTAAIWWTMSPCRIGFNPSLFNVTNYGGLSVAGNPHNSYGIRPVISLKHDVRVSDGDGSFNSPYLIMDM